MVRLPPFNPYMPIITGVISVSVPAVLVKLAADAPAAMIAFYYLLFACIIMLPGVLMKHRHELKRLTGKDWIFSICSGIFLAVYFIFWFESLNYTSVTSSVVLVTLQPVFAFIGTYFFIEERFSPAALISMVIALLGSLIIIWGDYQHVGMTLLGNILALFAAVAITGYFLTGQNSRRKLSFIPYTFVVYGIAMVTLVFYNIILQNPFFGFPLPDWWVFLALAIIPTFFGQAMFNWAVRWVNTATISMANLFRPIIASIFAYFILDERITSSQWLGGAIVISGLFLFIMGTRRKRHVTISEKRG